MIVKDIMLNSLENVKIGDKIVMMAKSHSDGYRGFDENIGIVKKIEIGMAIIDIVGGKMSGEKGIIFRCNNNWGFRFLQTDWD